MFKYIFQIFLLILVVFYNINAKSENGPTLLKKSEKVEKFREEVLVTKKVNIDDLYLKKYLNIDLVKKIFPTATRYEEIDKDTFSSAIYNKNNLLGYIFETYDITRGLGYSRRPFHIAVGIDLNGFIKSVELLKHVEPIAILGRTDEDFIKYLKQYKNIDLKSGVSLTLELTGSSIEGDNIAMRETAGDTSQLTQIDGVSRTTTSSLLFMDAIMRGARKLARQKDIILATNDIGNYIDLETYEPKSWSDLIKENSIAVKEISVGQLQNKFNKAKLNIPRKLKYLDDKDLFANIYFASVSASAIGVNILGRRWYDQYISAGRNVDDQVYYIALAGKNWLSYVGRIENLINNNNIYIKQNNNKVLLSKNLFKELPFNHAKGAPNILGQGLFYLSSNYKINPQKSLELVYQVKNDEKDFINIDLEYKLPDKFNLKEFSFDTERTDLNLVNFWQVNTIITFLTFISACFFFIFTQSFTKRTKFFKLLRILFLTWTLVWLGWYVGAQLSVIHMVNLFTMPFTEIINLNTFLLEPAILIIGLGTIFSLILWGRGVFCGWLCPFGSLQELLSIASNKLKMKRINIPKKIESKMRYFKYIILLLILSLSILESNLVNYIYNIEPFKAAITLKFIAPHKALVWAVFLLFLSLYIERAYCRYVCPLGGGLALIGKLRIFNYLKRRKECGNPCKACNSTCPTGAIQDNGQINMNECLGCLDCQIMFQDYAKCPPLVASRKSNNKLNIK